MNASLPLAPGQLARQLAKTEGNCRKLVALGSEQSARDAVDRIRSEGWQIYSTPSARDAESLIGEHAIRVGLVALDGFSSQRHAELEALLRRSPGINWIGLLEPDCIEQDPVRRLIAEYCYDYHLRPIQPQRLLDTLGHAHGMAQLTHNVCNQQISGPAESSEIIGASPAVRAVRKAIEKIARVDAHVTVTGESGTGKELVARAIHRQSCRNDAPFVAVNCGALPESLIQAELFGYEKGAFSGAQQRKLGRIETAHNGVIFLDEIGELPLDLQANLLQFLQQKTINRIGASRSLPMNVRIIAATNIDLEHAVAEGRCREELYYRINVLRLHLPPLRERTEDIEILAHHFLERAIKEVGSPVTAFSARALEAMQAHTWPGNVRELFNSILRAVVMTERRLIYAEDLGLGDNQPKPHSTTLTLQQARADAEQRALRHGLNLSDNNLSEAARLLRVSRNTLYRLLRTHGMSR